MSTLGALVTSSSGMRRSAAVHGAALVILAVASVALIAGFSLRSGRSKHFSVDSSVAQTVDFATAEDPASAFAALRASQRLS